MLGVLWGGSFPAIGVVVAHLPPLSLAAARYGVAGLVVLGYAAARTGRVWPRSRREVGVVAAVGVSTFGVYQGALFVGTRHASSDVAAVVVSLSPVVAAAAGQAVLPDESVDATDAVGFLFGVVGVLLVARPSPAGFGRVVGVTVVACGAVAFGLGAVCLRRFDTPLPTVPTQAWAMLVGSGSLAVAARLRGESLPAAGSVPPVAVGAFAYVALVAGVGGYLLYFGLVERVGATRTTLVAYLEPVVAVVVAATVLGRSVAPATVGGFLVVACGFLLVQRDRLRRALNRRHHPT